MTGSLRVHLNIPKKLVEMGYLQLWSSLLAAMQPNEESTALVTEDVPGQNVNTSSPSMVLLNSRHFFILFAFKVILISYIIFIESA